MSRLTLDSPIPLIDAFPELVEPLVDALMEVDESALAASVHEMKVQGLCGCGDSFCGSFVTDDGPGSRPYVRTTRTIALGAESPMTPFAVDVLDDGGGDEIYFVEIIDADGPSMSDFKGRYDELTRHASGAEDD